MQLGGAIMYPTDTVMMSFVITLVLAVHGLLAWALLLWGVKEQPLPPLTSKGAEENDLPFTVVIMRMLRNQPYRWCTTSTASTASTASPAATAATDATAADATAAAAADATDAAAAVGQGGGAP